MNPSANALNILKDYGIKKPGDLNLEDISFAENLIIDEEPMENALGRIQFKKGLAIAKINSNIIEKGQKRFTLAHEMGHYFNERELRENDLFTCLNEDINSFNSNKIWEANANEFASELLMPSEWFKKFTGRRKLNFDLIKDTAGYFNASLTATAIKYANIGSTPSAVIMSKGEKVIWHCKNEYFPLKWIPKNYKVDRKSKAYKFFAKNEIDENDNIVMANTWYEDTRGRDDLYLWEQNVFMSNYNSVLTLLWQFED
ncbi:MAG: ImmA/IrrE family metallo-endopeptidase [Ignavibacteriae bacterium]|nr:ImmA/IrrE family metallo-endopeptidase [Ignavibacteriota bacterium]